LLPPRRPSGYLARPELAPRIASGLSGRRVAVIASTSSAGDLRFAGEQAINLKGIGGLQRMHLVDWRL